MQRVVLSIAMACLAAGARSQDPGQAPPRQAQVLVHSITDISHEFLFYFDGRFGAQYVTPAGGANVQNWATLHECDLSRANLLVLQSGATPCRYLPEDVEAVRAFLEQGGGVLVLGDHVAFRDEDAYHLNTLAAAFGAEFVERPAREPLRAAGGLKAEHIETYGGRTIQLTRPAEWEVLIRDARRRVVMARKAVGKGRLLLCSRALAGRQPDASDPINAAWWQPLLQEIARGKPVDASRPPHSTMPENTFEQQGIEVQCSEYLRPEADAILEIYSRCRPGLEQILGVPPAQGMLARLILLPTGGGGFSSGHAIGLGVWWGNFPSEQYGMVEFLGHEATHSWVLPFAEPMWNEGLATYVGIVLGRELGYGQEADAALRNWLEQARRDDPEFRTHDLAHGADVPHAVRMAKPMWIWEQLRERKPDVLARYFRLKRALIDPAGRTRYTADDCVAVLSRAVERDLFPWFRSLGIDVDLERTTVPIEENGAPGLR